MLLSRDVVAGGGVALGRAPPVVIFDVDAPICFFNYPLYLPVTVFLDKRDAK